MYWLGMLVASNRVHLRTFFQILLTLGAFLAIHTIIQNATGTIVFGSAHIDAYLTQVSHYDLTSYGIPRPGSFLINPDWNGTFFAMLLFLPIGLFAEATSFIQKILCIIEVLLMSIALLLTFSIGAWIGFLAGIIVFRQGSKGLDSVSVTQPVPAGLVGWQGAVARDLVDSLKPLTSHRPVLQRHRVAEG